MTVSINQPAYLPWLGYLDRIKASDVFVYLDTVQFEKGSFVNRNKIKTPQGAKWLTVPVRTSGLLGNNILKETEIAGDEWRESHWNQIVQSYKKAPHWNRYSDAIKDTYARPYRLLSNLCWEQLTVFLGILGIKTTIVKSSELPIFDSRKDELVLDVLTYLRADDYISGKMGRGYLDEEKFRQKKITLRFQDYKPRAYRQSGEKFMAYMAVIDLLFNEGEDAPNFI